MAPTQILFNAQNQVSVSIQVDKDIASAITENGRKVIKAGTPLAGDLTNRAIPYTAASGSAAGLLLHDVDVTDGHANGTLLIWGFVNLNRIDSTTQGLLTTGIQEDLAGRVYFLKDD